MQSRKFILEGPIEITPKRFGDARGYFMETFNAARMNEIGVAEKEWIQDNQSLSAAAFTLRGMHFQLPPFAQAKIVRVIRGKIWDAVVDIRPLSKTFGQWVGLELSAEAGNQLYVPTGFAHGFLTLEPEVEIAYKVSQYYAPHHDRSLNWSDPSVGITWPLPPDQVPILSAKDEAAPSLNHLRAEIWPS
ncbi:MAG: dTDP-4-dehydrorhamnose 3,5-epimerase [Alphaproteobacteria bacterium]|nr:dTDP-4-dehydrorhamnose 3,5-epimerase [Alphaproteobacteria bacterium]